MKQAFNANVLIYFRPVYALAGSNEAKVGALPGRRLGQPPGPCEGHADNSAIDQISDDLIIGYAHFLDSRLAIHHSAHPNAPESLEDVNQLFVEQRSTRGH